MDRESQELYQGGEEVMVGTYRNLKTGQLVHIYEDRGVLPALADAPVTYEWISGDPDWDEEESE